MSAEGEMKTEATKQEVQTGQSEPVAPGGPEPDHNADKVNKGGAVPEDSQPIIVDKPDAETARQEMDTDKPKIDEPIAALTLYGFILVMSFVVMVEASIECDRANNCSDERGWAVTVSVISIICTGVAIALEMYTDVCSDIIGVIFAFFLLLLWSGGAGVLTFRAPFTATGNGYFASWLAWFASAYLVYSESPFLKRRVSEVFSAGLHFKSMLAIVLGSIVVLIAGAILCAEENCTNQNAYSVAVPSVAIPIVLPFMFLTMLQEYAIVRKSPNCR
uniref:Uncharacterized protein n=1 Tax=Lotharella globosa TaxID=91324 RepID=A0A7S4DJZ8_9EUKA|mmetsp:Transcript_22522/g.45226  ORF Transcript_22522/g.45226 Transcript_22522/m.45226 type:complete len:275 (+) Transcript_22522:62-886(+)